MNTLILLAVLATGQQPAPAALPTTFHAPVSLANKGNVKAGPALIHVFELVHNGTGTVTITKVEAGCGCLRQSLESKVLQPGEKTKLTLEVNTLTQPDGPNRWQIAVTYSIESPGVPAKSGELLLHITATLSRDFTITPPQLAFSTTGEANQTLKVTDKRAKPITITKAVSSTPHLTIEVAAAKEETTGRVQAVTVKLDANAPTGHRDEVVVLYTDDAACPELRVPVRVLKRSDAAISTTPEELEIRLAAGQKEASSLVQLRSRDGKPLRIQGTECDMPGIQVKHSTGAGPVATVRVTVPESLAGQAGRCTLRVRIAEPAGEVAIPVSWTGPKK